MMNEPLNIEEFQNLYFKVIDFFQSAGGGYTVLYPNFFAALLECLDLGQYYIRFNEHGDIVQFCNYWLIEPDDLAAVECGKAPGNIRSGSILYFVELHNADSAGLYPMIRCLRKKLKVSGVAYKHKGVKFNYFARQHGGDYGEQRTKP